MGWLSRSFLFGGVICLSIRNEPAGVLNVPRRERMGLSIDSLPTESE